MCDSWRKLSNHELRVPEIESIFAQLPQMDAVRLSGGEPFVRRDLPEIVHLVQTRLRPLVLHITTNGFLAEQIVQFCENRDKTLPLHLLFSIDGMREKHNHIRGRESAWDNVVQTLQSLAPHQKELRLNIAVNQTIVDTEGLAHYTLLRDFLRPLGIHNHVVMAYDVSATYNQELETNVAPTNIGQFATFGEFTQDDVERLLNEVGRDVKTYPLLTRIAKQYYLSGIQHRLLEHRGYPNPKCVALSSHLRLFPDGSIPTCQFNTSVVGNLRSEPFNELWHGAKIRRQRAWVDACPGCWAECEVLPSAIYTGDLLKKFVGSNQKRFS
jgi:MoaA/NifB/PqqE/SkfB family radical SAM enzyme